MDIAMGAKARDKISGFTGIVVGRCAYITGNDDILILPPVGKDGAYVEAKWFDVDRVERVAAPPKPKRALPSRKAAA